MTNFERTKNYIKFQIYQLELIEYDLFESNTELSTYGRYITYQIKELYKELHQWSKNHENK